MHHPLSIRLCLVSLVLLATTVTKAQNPSFNGKEFELVFVEGQPLPSSTLDIAVVDLVNRPEGAYVFAAGSTRNRPSNAAASIVLFTQEEVTQLVHLDELELNLATSIRFVGLTAEGGILFKPGDNIQNTYPVYQWFDGALSEFLSPEQSGNNLIYANGNVAFQTNDVFAGIQSISAGIAGEAVEIINQENTNVLVSFEDFDGTSVLYLAVPEGSPGSTRELLLRSLEGVTTSIWKPGDMIPGQVEGKSYGMGLTSPILENGTVYFDLNEQTSRGSRDDQDLFVKFENGTSEILFASNNATLGFNGKEIESFQIHTVSDGSVFVSIEVEEAGSGLYELTEGNWTLIVDKSATFDSQNPTSYNFFRYGHFDDTLFMSIRFGDIRSFSNRLYSNTGIRGPQPIEAGIGITRERIDPFTSRQRLQFSRRGGTHVRILSSRDLRNWMADPTLLPYDEDGNAEHVINGTIAPVFYRAEDITPPESSGGR